MNSIAFFYNRSKIRRKLTNNNNIMNYWESSSLKLMELEKDLPLNLLKDLRMEEERFIPDLVMESLS